MKTAFLRYENTKKSLLSPIYFKGQPVIYRFREELVNSDFQIFIIRIYRNGLRVANRKHQPTSLFLGSNNILQVTLFFTIGKFIKILVFEPRKYGSNIVIENYFLVTSCLNYKTIIIIIFYRGRCIFFFLCTNLKKLVLYALLKPFKYFKGRIEHGVFYNAIQH